MLSIMVRPFVLVVLFFGAAFIAHHVLKFVKPGRLRNVLTRRMVIIPVTEADRKDWLPVILLFGFTAVLWAFIWFSDPLAHHCSIC
jgi:hypothetical protein